jgi:hypothetical protein
VAEYSSSVNDDYCDIVKIAQKEYEQARAENIARELSKAKLVAMTSSYAATIKYILELVELEVFLFEDQL